MKKREDSDALILRFFETRGEACEAVLTLPEQIKKVQSANLLEEEEKEIEIKNGKVEMEVRPFEIVTLILEYSG